MTGRQRSGGVRSAFARIETVLLRLVGSLLQVVLSVLVARWGGAAVLGQFFVFVAVVNIAISVGGGLPNLLLRHASATTEAVPQHGWLWRTALGIVGMCGVGTAVAAALGSTYVALLLAAVGALLLQRMSSSPVKAADRPRLGVLLDTALWPLLLTAEVVLWRVAGGEIAFRMLAVGYLIGLLLATLVAVVATRHLPSSPTSARRVRERAPRSYYVEVGIVSVGSAARVVSANAPLALAPLFLDDAGAGRLGLALRVAGFATTIVVALAAHFSPLFARAQTRTELLSYRRQSQLASLALYLPVLVAALLLPTEWLRLLGDDFAQVKELIAILAAGYLLTAATGLVPQLLLMRGRSAEFSRTGFASAVLTLAGVMGGGWLGGELGLCAGISAAMVTANVYGFLLSSRVIRDEAWPALEPDPAGAAPWSSSTGARR